MNYFQQMRHSYISEFIKKNGYINRSDITDKFGVSIPQASTDLARWMANNPEKIEYNPKTKRYEVQK